VHLLSYRREERWADEATWVTVVELEMSLSVADDAAVYLEMSLSEAAGVR
jgi:hypothetical protein